MGQERKWKNHQGSVLDSKDGFEVIECTRCGFKHIIPIPTCEELDEVYRQDYYSKEKPLYLERHREDQEWWNLVYGDRYDTFEELLAPERRHLLDVGSGPGFFLLYGKQRGWETMGIEPSAQAAAHSQELGLIIIHDFLTPETARQLGKFDVIHMSEVLEHIPDPKQMLELSHSLLDAGGIVCVAAPNDYNPFQRALREACGFSPWWVAPPHHVNYFDFDSLSHLFEKCGFEVVLKETTFPIDIFLLMGDNYVGNDTLGRQCHGKRKNLEHNLAAAGLTGLKRRLYQSMAELGLGREVVLFGRKKQD